MNHWMTDGYMHKRLTIFLDCWLALENIFFTLFDKWLETFTKCEKSTGCLYSCLCFKAPSCVISHSAVM